MSLTKDPVKRPHCNTFPFASEVYASYIYPIYPRFVYNQKKKKIFKTPCPQSDNDLLFDNKSSVSDWDPFRDLLNIAKQGEKIYSKK